MKPALMAVGYPVGAVLGGLVVAWLLTFSSWRAIFLLGGFATLAMIPVALLSLPETIFFLSAKRRGASLEQVNRALRPLRREPVLHLAVAPLTENQGEERIFDGRLRKFTLLAAGAYFTHVFTFYYLLKWAVKLAVDAGCIPSQGATVLVGSNLAGGISGTLIGMAGRRWG